ncbi:MAG: glutamate-5-semialdehyde dehydrogenase [Candidatus Omnitrophica bacterium]|nr:glutamate-5-semialdehyde dehydrogenase [Candidatus Omnitrophota bacterium]MDE2221599.1 glutamate-5-semialdehyde dehydrogenase [Candidatus Omnitrophota bacterium]
MNLSARILETAKRAKKASYQMALVSTKEKNQALLRMADALTAQQAYLMKENAKDLAAAAKAGYSKALVDRLTLNPKRIAAMADGLRETAKLKDPVGQLLETIKRPNGLLIKKIRVPLGVVGIIYESRPNVTADCAALCLKSGNAAILKGGKEAIFSNMAIFKVLKSVLKKSRIPLDALQLVESTDRAAVHELLKIDEYLDVIVPRGGESLIRFVAENSNIPVIKHFKGVCHVYVSSKADLKMAHKIAMNAKTQKPGVCNAMETLLVDKAVARQFLPAVIKDLQAAGCAIRGDQAVRAIVKDNVKKATEEDWRTEYLDLILSVRVVKDCAEAIEHINTYGSHHSDTIVTKDKKQAQSFLDAVDSACVYVNASTRFTDGFEFGFGAEVGISTDKLHVRGPMALEGLTSYKYEIYGNGQIRS